MNREKIIDFGILKTLVVLAIPTILEQFFSTLLQYVDTAMVGHLGEQATAAVSVTTTITWLVGSIESALGVAVLAMISKAVGANQKQFVKQISKQVLTAVIVTGVLLSAVSMALSPFIPVWMGAEKAVQKPASIYFFIISIPLVFRAANTLFGAAIRATQDTRTPMYISLFANILNVLFNLFFIYRLDMGVTGAAVASAISYTISGILMFIAYRRNEWLYWEAKSFQFDKEIMQEAARLTLPVLGTNVASCFGYVVFAGMVSGMGTTIFAAHSIAVTAETCFYIPGYGIRTATSAMVGLSYGENDKYKFYMVSKLSIGITILIMLASGFILYYTAYPLMCLFTDSREVAAIGARMLRIVAFSEPFYGVMVVMEGISYGLGRTKYAFFVEASSMWGIRIFMTFLCVKIWHFGLEAVWYCMIADNICKALLFLIPFLTKKGRSKMLSWNNHQLV